jgi:hypothetical protein
MRLSDDDISLTPTRCCQVPAGAFVAKRKCAAVSSKSAVPVGHRLPIWTGGNILSYDVCCFSASLRKEQGIDPTSQLESSLPTGQVRDFHVRKKGDLKIATVTEIRKTTCPYLILPLHPRRMLRMHQISLALFPQSSPSLWKQSGDSPKRDLREAPFIRPPSLLPQAALRCLLYELVHIVSPTWVVGRAET